MGQDPRGDDRPGGRLWGRLAVADPGGLRLGQAARTLLAVGIALLVFRRAGLDARLFAALGTGIFVQCAEGAGWRARLATQLASGLAMTAAAAAGTALAGSERGQWALLTAAAFLAFALRRFVPRRVPIPLFGFVLCLLGAVLPGGPPALASRLLALGAGLAIAVGVYFLVFPPDRRRAFAAARDLFRAEAGRALWSDRPDWDATLDRLLAFEQGIADSLPDLERLPVDPQLADLYEAHQSLTLFRELLGRIGEVGDDDLSARLGDVADGLAAVFDRFDDHAPGLRASLDQAEELIRHAPPDPRTTAAAAALFSARRLAAVAARLGGSPAAEGPP